VKSNRFTPAEMRSLRRGRTAALNTAWRRVQPARVLCHVLDRCSGCTYRLHRENIDCLREVMKVPPVSVIEWQVIKCWGWHGAASAAHGSTSTSVFRRRDMRSRWASAWAKAGSPLGLPDSGERSPAGPDRDAGSMAPRSALRP
jgi:hypothetical protein